MLYQLSYVGPDVGNNPHECAEVKHVDAGIARVHTAPMSAGSQALCDALLALGEPASGPPVKAERLAAALVLLGAVDDDLVADLDTVPPSIRAVFDAAG